MGGRAQETVAMGRTVSRNFTATAIILTNIPAPKEGEQMTRIPSIFRQQDLTKAIRGATKAGVNIAQIEIAKDGRIVILTAPKSAQLGGAEEENEWDRA